jgi:hypothetical protein
MIISKVLLFPVSPPDFFRPSLNIPRPEGCQAKNPEKSEITYRLDRKIAQKISVAPLRRQEKAWIHAAATKIQTLDTRLRPPDPKSNRRGHRGRNPEGTEITEISVRTIQNGFPLDPAFPVPYTKITFHTPK